MISIGNLIGNPCSVVPRFDCLFGIFLMRRD